MTTITQPATPTLHSSYARCRALNRRHGVSYYVSTLLLPPAKRHHVHGLYAFCRYADDVVDDIGPAPVEERRQALTAFGDRFFADLARGASTDPVLEAVVHTVLELGLDPGMFRRFLRSMHMDFDTNTYETYADLLGYMDGSAAVIGEMLLPVLEPSAPAVAFGAARDLGLAFQLTNFLRDVGEDLSRGRVYIPQEDLRRFRADPYRHTVDDAWRSLMRFEIGRARDLYASARRGIDVLPPRSARCVACAWRLYGSILTRIEANAYDVFTTRATVPLPRKVAVAARELVRR